MYIYILCNIHMVSYIVLYSTQYLLCIICSMLYVCSGALSSIEPKKECLQWGSLEPKAPHVEASCRYSGFLGPYVDWDLEPLQVESAQTHRDY